MTTLIVSSTEDPASTNIKNHLLMHNGWQENEEIFNHPVYRNNLVDSLLVTIDDKHILHNNVDREVIDAFNMDLHQIIVVSRHRSKTGEPTLTTHPVGNFGEAKFGGRNRTFVESSPHPMSILLRLIKKHAENNGLCHQVSFEVTHHGPYVETPVFYAEVGSTKEEWEKELPAKTIADAVFELISKYKPGNDIPGDTPVLVGIGGGHYAPRFTDMVFEKDVAFGHMIPSYQIDAGLVDKEILQKVLDATPSFNGVYIHRKTLKKPVVRWFEKVFEEMDVKVWRSADLKPL
ncbi:MAG TPA: hypothetical protein EYP23_06945 [Thermoplasmata archaeon]|nr:hypothetical protein [Thermoplasmata archaeon]